MKNQYKLRIILVLCDIVSLGCFVKDGNTGTVLNHAE